MQVDTLIPSVELGAYDNGSRRERRLIARDVDKACRSTGFLVVTDHGVPPDVVDNAWHAASNFFELPLEQKLAASADDPGCPRGYFPVESETLAKTRGITTLPDRKECFSSGPLSPPADVAGCEHADFFYGSNLWPQDPPGFRDAWIACYREMETLGARIMALLAHALDLEGDFFVAFHRHHLSALRALNYPPNASGAGTGQPRAGAHSDYGSLTILKPDPAVGGLEIRPPGGDWTPAPVVTDAFIVNIGDLLARWTNDRWVSTLHRVSDAGLDSAAPRRQSIAYFMNPDYDARIETIATCLDSAGGSRYGPVSAGEYLMQKFSAAL